MKLLKELAIGSKKTEELLTAQQFIQQLPFIFFLPFIAVALSLLFLLPSPATKFLFLSVWIMLYSASVLSLYRKRKQELDSISAIIKRIRTAEISSETDVQLPPALNDAEQEIRLMFRKLNSDIEYLKRLEKMRTEFLGNVSHELKTPLFTIQGYLETLQRGALSDAAVSGHFLEKAIYHTELLSNLVHDLIDISQIESGEMRMSFRVFDVTDFCRELVKEYLPRIEQKGLQIELISEKNKMEVLADKTRLRQVFVNLIDNAMKYTDEGKIEIRLNDEKKMVRVEIADTGIGLSPEEQLRVFERFYRVDKARSREAGGTGLGLAIVKHIIEAHNSKVELQSSPGNGSVFSFRLKKY